MEIRDKAEPVRAKLGIPVMRRPPGQGRCTELLPLPLYVAYVQLAAAQEAFDLPAEVSITGPSSFVWWSVPLGSVILWRLKSVAAFNASI